MAKYTFAAKSMDWGMSAGYLFPNLDCKRGSAPLTAAQMTASLQAYQHTAKMPDKQYTMHLFPVGDLLSQSLAGTVVDAIMELVGWKSEEKIALWYIGPTAGPSHKADRGSRHAEMLMTFRLSPEFRRRYAAFLPTK